MGTRRFTQRSIQEPNQYQQSLSHARLRNQNHTAARSRQPEILPEIIGRSHQAAHFDYNFALTGGFAKREESCFTRDISDHGAIDISPTVMPPASNIQISDPDPQRRTQIDRELKSITSGWNAPLGTLYIHIDAKARRHTVARGTVAHLEGNTIYLDPEHYRPDAALGRRILAHEIVHAAQRQVLRFSGIPRDLLYIAAELEAVLIADRYTGGSLIRPPRLTLPTGYIAAFTNIDPAVLMEDLKEAFYRAVIGETGIHPSKQMQEFLSGVKDAFTTGTNLLESKFLGALAQLAHLFIDFPITLDLRDLPDSTNAGLYADLHLEADPKFQHLVVAGSLRLGFWGVEIVLGQRSGDQVQIFIPWGRAQGAYGKIPPAHIRSLEGEDLLQTGPGEFTAQALMLDFAALRLPDLKGIVNWRSRPLLRAEKLAFTGSSGLEFDRLGLYAENSSGYPSLRIGDVLTVKELNLDAQQNRKEVAPDEDVGKGMSLTLSAKAVNFRIPGGELTVAEPEIVYDTKEKFFSLRARKRSHLEFLQKTARLSDLYFEATGEGFKGGFQLNKDRQEGPRVKLYVDSQGISLEDLHAEWKVPILDILTLDIDLIQAGAPSTLEGARIGTNFGTVALADVNFPNLDYSSIVEGLMGGAIPVRHIELPLPKLPDLITWDPQPSLRISGFNLTGDGLLFEKIKFHGKNKFTLKVGEIITVKQVEFNATREGMGAPLDTGPATVISISASADALEIKLPEMIGGPLQIGGPALSYKFPTNHFQLSAGTVPFQLLGTNVELQNIVVKRDSKGFRGRFAARSTNLSTLVEIDSQGVVLNHLYILTQLGTINVDRILFGDTPSMHGIRIDAEPIFGIDPILIREFNPYRFFKLFKQGDLNTLIQELGQSQPAEKKVELLRGEQVASATGWYGTHKRRYPAEVVTRIQAKVGAKPNGIMDSHSIRSIARWQQNYRLEADGKAGAVTLVAMFGRDIRPIPEDERRLDTQKGAAPQVDEKDTSFKDKVKRYLDKYVLFPDFAEAGSTTVSPEAALPKTPDEDKALVSPPPRKPKHGIRKKKGFKSELDGQALDANLVNQIDKMADFAIKRDLVSGNIWYTSGMRSLKNAHRMSTAWSIREGRVTRNHLANLKNSRGQRGVDEDGNRWFMLGWSAAKVKDVATQKWSGAQAAEGYPKGDKRRRPNTYKYVTKHATGRAMDVVFPWGTRGQVKDPQALEKLKSRIKAKYKNRPKALKNRLQTVDRFVARGSYSDLAVEMVETFRLRRPLLHSKSTEDWHYELAKDYKPDQDVNEKTERQQAEKVARSKPVPEETQPKARGLEKNVTGVEKTETKTNQVTLPESASPAEPRDAEAALRQYATFVPFTETYFSLDEEGLGQYLAQLPAKSALVQAVLERLDPGDHSQVSQFLGNPRPLESESIRENFSGRVFTIEDSFAVLRDDALKPLKYEKGDQIPKGKRVGSIKIAPKSTKVHVSSTKTTAKKTTYALVYPSDTVQPLGWTAVTNFAGRFENVVTGMRQADDSSAPTSGKNFTVTDPNALIRGGGPKYEPQKDTIPIGIGKYVSVQQRSLDTKPEGKYVLIKVVGDNNKDPILGENLVWTAASNLQEGWGDIFGPHAAWEEGKYIGQVDLVNIVGTRGETEKIEAKSYSPYIKMVHAAAREGLHIGLNSGFRTYNQQATLHKLFMRGKGNLAAPPGRSNHQNGKAFDLNTSGNGGAGRGPLYNWLKKNARKYNFVRTVRSEHWHWEYRPEKSAKGKHTTWGA